MNVSKKVNLTKNTLHSFELKQIFYERFYQFVIEFKTNGENLFIVDNASSNDQLLNVIAINFNFLEQFPQPINVPGYFKCLERKLDKTKRLNISLNKSSLIK